MRKPLPLLAAATALVLTSACGSVPTRPAAKAPDAAGPATIRLLSFGFSPDVAMDNLVSAFHARYPNYRVEKVPFQPGPGFSEMIVDKIKSGEVDVVAGLDMKEPIAANGLLALDPYIQASRFDLKPLGPGLDQLRVDGKLYDLPFSIQPQVLMYNQDMFQAAGVPLPGEGWTWDQFREAARRLTQGTGDARVWGFSTPFIESMVAAYLYQKTGLSPAQADEKALREALQFFATMVFSDQSIPPVERRDFSGAVRIMMGGGFAQGKAAMANEMLLGLQFTAANIKFKWDVAPMPVLPGGKGVATVNPQTVGIAAATRVADAAWHFVSFVAGPEGAAAVAKGGGVPMYNTPEVRKAWFDRQPPPPPGTETLFNTRWAFEPRLSHNASTQLFLAGSQAISDALSGTKTVDQAVADFVQSTAQIRAGMKK